MAQQLESTAGLFNRHYASVDSSRMQPWFVGRDSHPSLRNATAANSAYPFPGFFDKFHKSEEIHIFQALPDGPPIQGQDTVVTYFEKNRKLKKFDQKKYYYLDPLIVLKNNTEISESDWEAITKYYANLKKQYQTIITEKGIHVVNSSLPELFFGLEVPQNGEKVPSHIAAEQGQETENSYSLRIASVGTHTLSMELEIAPELRSNPAALERFLKEPYNFETIRQYIEPHFVVG